MWDFIWENKWIILIMLICLIVTGIGDDAEHKNCLSGHEEMSGGVAISAGVFVPTYDFVCDKKINK